VGECCVLLLAPAAFLLGKTARPCCKNVSASPAFFAGGEEPAFFFKDRSMGGAVFFPLKKRAPR